MKRLPAIALSVWLCAATAALAADAPEQKITPDLEKKIRALLKQLGDPDWTRREAATTELQFIGKPAAPFVAETQRTTEDAEVRSRCETILNFINPPPPPPPPAEPPGRIRLGGGLKLQLGAAPNAHVVQTTVVTKTFSADGKNYVVTDMTENQTRSITVEITEKADGKEIKTVVKAADEKELETKNPALFKIIKDNEANATVQRRLQAMAQVQMGGFVAPATPAPPPLDPATLDLLDTYGMKLRLTDDGVIVADLKANSPADKAEMRVGDTVKKINAAPIATIDDARKILGDTSPDNPLEVEVVRSGKTLNFKLTPETK
jgi:hypothetical protein